MICPLFLWRKGPREGAEGEQLDPTTASRPVEMPEVLRAKFLTSMFKMKKHTQKGQPTIQPSPNTEPTVQTMTAGEQRNLLATSSPDMPSFNIPTDTGSLSGSDKETE
jgi:hypothetical protein